MSRLRARLGILLSILMGKHMKVEPYMAHFSLQKMFFQNRADLAVEHYQFLIVEKT
jgi:hypothetical protein